MFNGLNFAPLKEATIQKFGQPFQPNRYIEDYVWSGKLTDATLSERGGWLVIDSVQMVKLEKQWDKQQTAAGAARGF